MIAAIYTRLSRDDGSRDTTIKSVTIQADVSDLDAGPIVTQAAVPVLDDDTVETLSARILVEEHRIYPEAVDMVLAGTWTVEGRRFVRHR